MGSWYGLQSFLEQYVGIFRKMDHILQNAESFNI